MKRHKATARDKFGKNQRLSRPAWDERYRSREMAWDMGQAAPPLVRISKHLNILGKSVLVPGCGRGFEAQLFARRDADVTAVDFSQLALTEASKLAGARLGFEARRIEWVPSDVRRLPVSWTQRFDFVVEHTCFCALAPKDRETYLLEIHRVLKPSGRLVGLFFVDFNEPDGPPFGISQHELRRLLENYFQVVYWESHPPDSAEGRKNIEALVIGNKINTVTPSLLSAPPLGDRG